MILGIDTSGFALGLALADADGIVTALHVARRNSHDALLAPSIEHLLGTVGAKAAELTGVAVAAGPGSFTGLRIGLAAAKGFALALGTPILTIPTFDAMARLVAQSLPLGTRATVAAVLDARRGDVYAGVYEVDGGIHHRLGPVALAAIDAGAMIDRAATEHEPALLIGDGATIVDAAYPGKFRIFGVGLLTRLAETVALCGSDALQAGRVADPATCEPLYVREFQTTAPQRQR